MSSGLDAHRQRLARLQAAVETLSDLYCEAGVVDFLHMLYGSVEPMDAAQARHRTIAKAMDALWRDTVHMEHELLAMEALAALEIAQANATVPA